MLKNFLIFIKQYILIFLTAIFFFTFYTHSFAKQNNFFVNNIQISEEIDLDFDRDLVIDKIFKKAFSTLLKKVLLSKDLKKLENVKINEIKKLIESFQIFDESFKNSTYKATSNVFFNKKKIGTFLAKRGLVFSNPKNISLVFFSILYEDGDVKLFNENILFKDWNNLKKDEDLINFILPFEDLDEFVEIKLSQDKPDKINILNIARKYNTENYVIAIIEHDGKVINTFVKMNLDNEKFNVNINYIMQSNNLNEYKDEIINEIKTEIIDSWKEANIVNYSLPLLVNLHFYNKDLISLNNLQEVIRNMEIINKNTISEFSKDKTTFKIEYFGDPKKLYNEFLNYGYLLKEEQGLWFVSKNE